MHRTSPNALLENLTNSFSSSCALPSKVKPLTSCCTLHFSGDRCSSLPRARCFPGHETFSTRTRKVLDKLRWLVTLDFLLLPPISDAHCFFCLSFLFSENWPFPTQLFFIQRLYREQPQGGYRHKLGRLCSTPRICSWNRMPASIG